MKIFGITLSDWGELFVIIGGIYTGLRWFKNYFNSRINANLKKFDKRDKELADRNLAETRENRKTTRMLRKSIDKLNSILVKQHEEQITMTGNQNVKLENHEQRIRELEDKSERSSQL